MLSTIVKTIIQDEFKRRVHIKTPADADKITNAMLIEFSLYANTEEEYDDYPELELLIYGEYNYIGVYTRESSRPKTEREYTPYTTWSYHDSCWREDGIGRVISHYERRIQTFSSMRHWYQVISVSDELRAKLLEVRKDKNARP